MIVCSNSCPDAAAAYEVILCVMSAAVSGSLPLQGGWGCMLMCLLAVQKSVKLLGKAEGIDGI